MKKAHSKNQFIKKVIFHQSCCTTRDPDSRKHTDGKRRSFLEWKNWCLLLLQNTDTEQKSWPELLHWSAEDFLTAWMLLTLFGQWLRLHTRQCSVTPRKSDATVSTTEHSRLHSCWWMGRILHILFLFSQPSIYIDGWLYGMSMTSVVCNAPVSVTFRYCLKTIPHIIILSSRHESDIPSLPGRQVSSS